MDIQALREKIDQCDDLLTKTFITRMETALEIAKYKKANGLPVMDPARERTVISRVTEGCDEAMAVNIKLLYNTLFDLSRTYQQRYMAKETELTNHIQYAIEHTPKVFPKQAVVACQGVEGAYSQQACDKLFLLPNLMYCKRFEGVFQAIQSGLCAYGVLPIENSSYGSVTEVYDLMRKYRFSIVRSVRLKIDHRLLAKPGVKLADIKEIVSHEQAIGQCGMFLKGLKDVKVTVFGNTAEAAQYVSTNERNDLAAISSPACAALYGLNVVAESISDSDSNFTRFICIAKELQIFPGANRMSLMLNVRHTPGALYAMIAKFAALGLNLTKIESRPIAGTDFEFMFYFDLDAPVYAPEALQLLCELDAGPETFTYLGSYSEM
ncbi:MAG TPA: prephenate dehydratase domain-containing protein [Candidatus Limiplasma sp.]|nr:prephenate dehydratase domain-containing protein [Candidatus Limiplasma sp.]HPS82637.1 prephenate dehydratase domain-containing protein [Candidatus Limiplasma sp.]